MSYRVRDENGKVIPDSVYGGDMVYGSKLEKQIRALGKKISEEGKYLVRREYGSILHNKPSLDISIDKVDAMAFAMAFNKARKSIKDKGNEKMGNPSIQLETDKCGRYHFATAYVSRVNVLKGGCTEREVVVATGVARRQHGDPKDDYVGEGLAVGRALEELGYKLSRRAWGKVKHNDDIKVMRRQQKERRQAKAYKEKNTFVNRLCEAVGRSGL